MAQNPNQFVRPEQPSALEAQSSSSSPLSTSSESPRESSVAFSAMAFSPTRLNTMTEEAEDDFNAAKLQDYDMENVKLEPSESSSTLHSVEPSKRPRGRPRKHPKTEPSPPKHAKARSKTGCKTCRRRKKKCDETKPFCKNCETNNVVCEGYPEKTFWMGGVQKQKRRQIQSWQQTGPAPLPQFIPGLDTSIDWEFYHHYENELSKVLNLQSGKDNQFIGLFLPMAQAHVGVMHALLACSGSHFIKRLNTPTEAYIRRQGYHYGEAVVYLREKMFLVEEQQKRPNRDASIMCSALLLFLRTIVDGDITGEWRSHEIYFNAVLNDNANPREGESADAWEFCREFYHFHRMSSFVTAIDRPEEDMRAQLSFSSGNGSSFMSVCEGLYAPFQDIHFLRRKIRQRRDADLSPDVPYDLMLEGSRIDEELKKIPCRHEIGTEEWLCWNFYKSCLWLMLQRSIMSGPDPAAHFAINVESYLKYFESIPENSPQQSVLVTPMFMLGTCAYIPEVRPKILHSFDVLQAYSHNGNIPVARKLLEHLWELMDQKDRRAWDYERVMKDMDIDILFT